MTYQEFERYLIDKLEFWPGEERRSFIKNAPTLSVTYILIEVLENGEVSISRRQERTIIGVVRFFDDPLATFNLTDEDLAAKTREIFNRQKSLS